MSKIQEPTLILSKLNEILSYVKDGENANSLRYIDINEVSELCSVSKSTIRRNVKANKLKASDTTGKLLFKVSDVEAWLNV
jgi:excisionase family DNA binding protein